MLKLTTITITTITLTRPRRTTELFTLLLLSTLFIFGCTRIDAKKQNNARNAMPGAGSEVEGFIRGFFDDQLTSASNQNMTDCMTRLLCENICQQTVQGKIKPAVENQIPASKLLGAQSGLMGYFFGGGDNGQKFGMEKNCQKCRTTYPNCLAAPYGQMKGVSDDYEKSMLEPDFNSFN